MRGEKEDDLISRQTAIDAVGDWIYNPEDLRYHKDVINSIPAAQPEIIRCKDCKHRHVENMVWTCPFGLPGGENFFCGYGTEPYKGE